MTKEELSKLSDQEYQETLTSELEKFKTEVQGITDMDTLNKMMDEMTDAMVKDKEFFDTRTYPLGPDCAFDGETFKLSEVANHIINFLGRMDVEYNATLGLYQAVKFWKQLPKENPNIPYGVLDTTLRLLQMLKFRGFTDWKNILIIGSYFSTNTQGDYNRDLQWLYFQSSKMNIIDDQMKLAEKANNLIDEKEVFETEIPAEAGRAL